MVRAGVTVISALNNATDINPITMFSESYIVIPGTTYNVQHEDTGQVITGIITQDEDDLNIS